MGSLVKLFFLVLFFLGISTLGVLAYHDYFTTPKVVEREVGPYTIATKRFMGSYSKVAPTMNEVEAWLKEINVNPTQGVGLYYDDPAKVKENDLRSDVGSVLEGVDELTLAKIKDNFDVLEIPWQKAVVVEYPLRSPLSYMLGPLKVYPVLDKYWQEKGYPERVEGDFAMEIYDIPRGVILYVMYLPR